MKREIRTISEQLKIQLIAGEEGIDLKCLGRFYCTLHNAIGYLKGKGK